MPQREAIKALIGVAAPLLTIGTVTDPATDPAVLAADIDNASPFQPRQWVQVPPFIMEHQVFTPNNGANFGVEAVIEVPKTCVCLEDAQYVATFPPLVAAAGATFLYYVDYLGFAQIEKFRIQYGANTNWEIYKWSLYRRFAKWLNNEKRASIAPLILGDMTIAQRSVFAVNGGKLYTPLYLPFADDTTQAFPIVTLSNKMRFLFKIEALTNLILTDGVGTVTTNGEYSCELYINAIHTSGTESNIFYAKSLRREGIAYLVHEPILQNSDDIANSNNNVEFRVRITNISRPLQILYWWAIPNNLINNTGTNDYFMYAPDPPLPIPLGMAAYNPFLRWRIEANGISIQKSEDIQYTRYYQSQKYHTAEAGEYIMFQTYSLNPEAINAALGYMDYGNLNNPTLYITGGTGGTGTYLAAPQSLRIMLEGLDYNFNYIQGGDWSLSFT